MQSVNLLMLILLISQSALAIPLKFRARESYELIQIQDLESRHATYKGLSNTINIFIEEPLSHSYGLAFGSILSNFETKSPTQAELTQKIQVYFLGLEGKYFPKVSDLFDQSFLRAGGYRSRILPQGDSAFKDGNTLYFGVGHEFFVANQITLCPEFGIKISDFKNLESYHSQVFSVALHFYAL